MGSILFLIFIDLNSKIRAKENLTAAALFGRWRPRWFVLQDGVLTYYKIHGPDKSTCEEFPGTEMEPRCLNKIFLVSLLVKFISRNPATLEEKE
ncbi:hypothetical protein CMV_007185 [Castanea mollissima]|uniref:PH domain-containing protein n=1 Tax=Castanea mollissima TaxID=60419 RepID=A0A8J4RU49_9ROSI|nr:hypothetical protein CMV_007185 [Castanea mollissima]